MAPDRGSKVGNGDAARAWDCLTPSLSTWILDAVASMNFKRMTPVQASTIPLFMAHKDVVVEAVTGSGKTLSFLIPVVERILRLEESPKRHHVAAIIVSPTRELAAQIFKVLESLLLFHEPSAAQLRHSESHMQGGAKESVSGGDVAAPKVLPQLLVGGATTTAQDLSLFLRQSPNLLIATPGRLLEIISSPFVHCSQESFEVLVLDEADRLLDLGFKDDLTKILALLPKQRRTGLFSASVSEAVDQIIRVGLRNPVRVAVKVRGLDGTQDRRTPASLRMTYLRTLASEKLTALAQILQQLNPTPLRTIVYLSTCAAVDYFQSLIPALLPDTVQLVPLHGKYPAKVREKNFILFTNSATPTVLLTTDVAARGLDVPEVDLVVQIDPPSDPKVFLHRCGRAGRAGRKGLSVVFLQPGHEEDYVSFLEVRKTPIEHLEHLRIEVTSEQVATNTAKLRHIVLQDRALHEKAQKAFVSWVRSYSKHQASSIFRVIDLDWADLATGWALLRLPRMPESKGQDVGKLDLARVDWDNYAYKDRQREKLRQKSLLESPPEILARQNKDRKRATNLAWSEKSERKAEKAVRRSRKEAKRNFDRKQKMTEDERAHEAETQRMIEHVQTIQRKASTEHEPFEGFD